MNLSHLGRGRNGRCFDHRAAGAPLMLGSRRYPALMAWRKELVAAKRTRLTFDPLWRAACSEAWALEVEAILPRMAADYRHGAGWIIKAVRKEST